MNTLRKKLLFIGLLILLAYSSVALAQADTETLITDTDTLDGGYYVRYREDISYYDTSLTVVLSSSEPIEFGVCDEGALEEWNDGGDYPVWYYNSEDVLTRSMTFILDIGTFDFCLLNWGVNTANYTITVTITYDPANTGSGNTIWYIIIGIVGIGVLIGIIMFMRSRKRKTQQHSQPSQYDSRQIYTPYQSTTYEQPSYASQAPSPLKPAGTKVCQNCGADMESDTVFCTNCGSRI